MFKYSTGATDDNDYNQLLWKLLNFKWIIWHWAPHLMAGSTNIWANGFKVWSTSPQAAYYVCLCKLETWVWLPDRIWCKFLRKYWNHLKYLVEKENFPFRFKIKPIICRNKNAKSSAWWNLEISWTKTIQNSRRLFLSELSLAKCAKAPFPQDQRYDQTTMSCLRQN